MEAFDVLISRYLITKKNGIKFLNSLKFEKNGDWLKFYYESKLNELATTNNDVKIMKNKLINNNEYSLVLSKSIDTKIIESNCYLNLRLYRDCYKITNKLIKSNPYNISSIPQHIVCLAELGKQIELYKNAHDLVEAYPTLSLSWFAIGCYYYISRRYETARRFLQKATALDKYNGLAWMFYGHSFTEQDADDQAMAAYRNANRLLPESHLPLLCIGIGYLNMSNYLYAEKFFIEAHKKYEYDPMIYNELGVVYYNKKDYKKALNCFLKGIQLISIDEYNVWESIFFNIGHCYRKLKDFNNAIKYYEKSFQISPYDPIILASIGFAYHLQNKLDDAIKYYHKVLALQPSDMCTTDLLHRALDETF